MGASVGLVQMNSHYADAVSLIKAADNACYTAKNNGRNQYHVHSVNDEEADLRQNELNVLEQAANVKRSSIVTEALKRGQPLLIHSWIYSLRNGRLKDLSDAK